MEFETERLRIGRIARTDAGFMLALLADPGFVANIGDRGVRTIADAERYVAERVEASWAAHGFGMLKVSLRDGDGGGGAPIGTIGLVRRDGLDGPDLGFAFLAAHTGRGYGREAAAALLARVSLRPLLAVTRPDNHASAALLAGLGFREEAPVTLPGHDAPRRLFRLDAKHG